MILPNFSTWHFFKDANGKIIHAEKDSGQKFFCIPVDKIEEMCEHEIVRCFVFLWQVIAYSTVMVTKFK